MIARRYSKLPSDLKDLDITDYQFNILAFTVGAEAEKKAQERAKQKSRMRRG